MFPFKYKDGTEPKQFDVVTFNVEDSDDFSNWAFICILTTRKAKNIPPSNKLLGLLFLMIVNFWKRKDNSIHNISPY